MNIIDKIMNALSLYDEEEIIEEEVEQKLLRPSRSRLNPRSVSSAARSLPLRYRQRSLSVNANPF